MRRSTNQKKTKSDEKLELSRLMDSINAAKAVLEGVLLDTAKAEEEYSDSLKLVEKRKRDISELDEEIVLRGEAINGLKEDQVLEEKKIKDLKFKSGQEQKDLDKLKKESKHERDIYDRAVRIAKKELHDLDLGFKSKMIALREDEDQLVKKMDDVVQKTEFLSKVKIGFEKDVSSLNKEIVVKESSLKLLSERETDAMALIKKLGVEVGKGKKDLNEVSTSIKEEKDKLSVVIKNREEEEEKVDNAKRSLLEIAAREKRFIVKSKELEKLYSEVGLKLTI